MAKIKIIGVPMDLGAGRRGVDMGPSAMRIARVGPRLQELGHEVVDYGNVSVRQPETINGGDEKARFINEISDCLKQLSDVTYSALKEGFSPLVLGGDHSIAAGSVAGIAKFHREKNQKIGIIWFDAHGDINTPETSLSGNVHGMPVAHILGRGHKKLLSIVDFSPMVDPTRLVLIGLRDLDPAERVAIKELGVRAFTMRDIDEMGLRRVMEEAIRTASSGTVGFHVSMDVDWLDPSEAPGVGTPSWGGATYREGHLALEMVADTGLMLSMEVTEVNPVLDHSNETASVATDMVLSAFGKKIL